MTHFKENIRNQAIRLNFWVGCSCISNFITVQGCDAAQMPTEYIRQSVENNVKKRKTNEPDAQNDAKYPLLVIKNLLQKTVRFINCTMMIFNQK